MAATVLIQTRVTPTLKEEATVILGAIGLRPSDAVRLLLTRVVAEKAFPMELLVPNEASLEALRQAREGRLHSAATFDEMLVELNADG